MRQNNHQNLPISTTFVLGAGFSKCADLPLQAEFSSLMFSEEFNTDIDRVITQAIKDFLQDVFGWHEGGELPLLEDIFTCIDLSAGTGHHLGIKYTPKVLRAIRRMAIYRIFSVLDRRFSYSEDIDRLIRSFCKPVKSGPRCSFIILNWDIVLEKHLMRVNPTVTIDYCCPCYDWNNPDTPTQHLGVPVCKMHGSSNWVYCENCKSLFFDLNEKLSLRTKAGLVKLDFRLFDEKFTDKKFDTALGISPKERECKFCKNMVSSHIATFSYRKSFRTPAYPSIWYHAEKLLSASHHWVFIGYSLPEADYELKHLLKAAQIRMSHRKSAQKKRIEIVVQEDLQTRHKFEKFFGPETMDFYNGGLSEYVSRVCDGNNRPGSV
jgi:hypothetical protein